MRGYSIYFLDRLPERLSLIPSTWIMAGLSALLLKNRSDTWTPKERLQKVTQIPCGSLSGKDLGVPD